MTTMQQVCDLARIDLNDTDKERNSDLELCAHANSGIRTVYQARPDLRFGSYATAVSDKHLAETFPLPDEYRRTVADYIVARANASEVEQADLSRANTFLSAFNAGVGG